MEEQYQKEKEIHSRTIIFVSMTGDIFMTLVDVNKEFKWSSILDTIATETWYKTCKRWRFAFGIKNLKLDDVLEFNDDVIKITCIKFEPQIIFELPTGELLVSISFGRCNSFYDVLGMCFKAHIKLKDIGENGYGTNKPKIHTLINTYTYCGHVTFSPNSGEQAYDFYNNGKLLDLYDILEDPGDDNLVIVAVPKQVYCSQEDCTKNYGMVSRDKIKISLCPVCGFLHCPSCGMYQYHIVGSTKCNNHHM